MSRKEVYASLSESGIPFAFLAWPKGSVPPLPWGVYVEGGTQSLYADDSLYARVTGYTVELYQKVADEAVEKKVEGAIANIGPFRKGEQAWIASEECSMTPYYFDYVERNDENGQG